MTAPIYPEVIPFWVALPALLVGVVAMFSCIPIIFEVKRRWQKVLAGVLGSVIALGGITFGGPSIAEANRARNSFQVEFAQYAALHAGVAIDVADIPFPDEQREARVDGTRRYGGHVIVKLVRDGRTWKVYTVKETATRVG